MEEKKELKIKFKTAVIAIIIVAIILVAIFAVVINKEKQEAEGNTIISEVDSNEQILESDFSLEFLKLENEKQNMVYSPLSIKYALNMLNEGAAGNTKTQIENVIGDLNLIKYNTIDEVLSLANSVYIRDTFAEYVKEDYRRTIAEKYNAEIMTWYLKKFNKFNINAIIVEVALQKNVIIEYLSRIDQKNSNRRNAIFFCLIWKKYLDS